MNGFIYSVEVLSTRWWHYVVHATWQSTVLALAILAVVWLLRRRSAALRYGVLLVALLVIIALVAVAAAVIWKRRQ